MFKQKYLLIIGDQIVARADSSAEAVRLSKKHLDADVWKIDDKPISAAMLVFTKEFESRWSKRRERKNPAGPAIANICWPTLIDVDAAITESIPASSLDSVGWGDGQINQYAKGWAHRRATNIECCRWTGSFEVRLDFDVRKPIPPQLGRWFKWLSARALAAAESVSLVHDDRKMALLHKVVNDAGYLDQLWEQKREIVEGGRVEKIPEYLIELYAQRRDESGVAA